MTEATFFTIVQSRIFRYENIWPFILRDFKLRTCEKSLVDFCTSVLLKALKINLICSKKKQMVKLAVMQMSVGHFSNGLDFSQIKFRNILYLHVENDKIKLVNHN